MIFFLEIYIVILVFLLIVILVFLITQVIKVPTRYALHLKSFSLVDVIFVKETSQTAKSEELPISISDHEMIGCVYKINKIKFNGRIIRCRDYRNYKPEQLQKYIRESNLSQLENIKTANNASSFFKSTLIDIFQKNAPNLTKKLRGKSCPWLVRGIKTKTIDQGYVLRKMRKTKLENDITAYKMKRNEVNICLRKAKSKYYQSLLDESIRSLERFRKKIKRTYHAKNKQSLPSKYFKVNSELTSDSTLITNGFAIFYTEIVPKLKKVLLQLNSVIWGKEVECGNFT